MSLAADCYSRRQLMARPTGLGCSPVLCVRLPAATHAAIKVAARLQGTTSSALARECLCACFAGLIDDLAIAQELQRRKAELGTSTEAEQ